MANIKYLGSILVIAVVINIFNFSMLETIKLRTFDAFIQEQKPSGYFTTISITEDDIRKRGGFPFPRSEYAQIQYDIMKKGALGVGWTMNFTYPDRFGQDEIFTEFIKDLPTVVATFENNNGKQPPLTGTVILGYPGEVPGVFVNGYMQNIPSISESAFEGLVSAPVEVDNLLRRMPLLYKTEGGYTPAFATQIIKRLAEADTYIVKQSEYGIEEITVQGIPPIPTDNLGRKFISFVDTPTTTLEELDVLGKFVIIGVSAPGILPQTATPNGLLFPQEIQTSLAESLLIPNSPTIPDYAVAVEFLYLIFGIIIIWFVLNRFTLGYALGLFLFIIALQSISGALMIRNGVLIDVTYPLIWGILTGGVAFYLNYRTQFKLRQQIKKQFEQYLDPRAVKELQKNPSLLKLGGEKRYCTYLFTDVRNFTSMSEELSPEQVTEIMNRSLDMQTNCILKHGGMISNYIGDAAFGIFNAPLDLDNHEEKAILCALEMRAELSKLNCEFEQDGLPQIEIGCGIQSGYSITGNHGSTKRFCYTSIGDSVNQAARLESATKEANAHILIGKETEKGISFDLTPLDPIKVKGKAKALEVFTWDSNST